MFSAKRHVKGVVVLLITLLVLVVIGCGGGGGGGGGSLTTGSTTATTGSTSTTTGTTSGSGNVQFTLQWPAQLTPSRGIPTYAESVEITAFTAGTSNIVQQESIDRNGISGYSQTITLSLPVGKYTITIDAKPLAGGSGDTLATATIAVTVNTGQTVTASFVMNSLVSKIFIDDLPASASVGASFQLTGHAEDKNGNAILLPPDALRWSIISGFGPATLTPSGFFTVVGPGSVTIQAREIDSGITTTKSITLNSGPANGVIIIVS